MPKDPPIGRIGYVIDAGFGTGGVALEPLERGRQLYCKGCRGWYMASTGECPTCGQTQSGFNKSIRTAQLNRHLLGDAASAKREPSRARGITSDISYSEL